MSELSAPFPWFGGKAAIAEDVWAALGDVDNYVEPFAGSAAVLLARPAHHRVRIETINDIDGFVANFWRATQADAETVARYADWPVNEDDLEARHRALCSMPGKADFLERVRTDDTYYDAERAGKWVWGLAAWIGSGWCEGEYWPNEPGRSRGTGVCDGAAKRPHLGMSGHGIHRQLPHLGNAGQGECARRSAVILAWIAALRDRLRNVRVCCRDWERICTDGATADGATVGIFLDPPYSFVAARDEALYRCEDGDVAHRVRDYCIARTPDRRYRIVLAGYEGEHDELESLGWRVQAWKTRGGFANCAADDDAQGKQNRGRERLWFSPSCIDPQPALF